MISHPAVAWLQIHLPESDDIILICCNKIGKRTLTLTYTSVRRIPCIGRHDPSLFLQLIQQDTFRSQAAAQVRKSQSADAVDHRDDQRCDDFEDKCGHIDFSDSGFMTGCSIPNRRGCAEHSVGRHQEPRLEKDAFAFLMSSAIAALIPSNPV